MVDSDTKSFLAAKLQWQESLLEDSPRYLSTTAFRVGAWLMHRFNNESSEIAIAASTVAAHLGLNRTTVTRALQILVERRWLGCRKTPKANVYWPRLDNIEAVVMRAKLLRRDRDLRRRGLTPDDLY